MPATSTEILTPEEIIHALSVALPKATPGERQRLLTHADASVTVHYGIKDVPVHIAARLNRLEDTWR